MPRAFRRSESGATAIEFALVAMPLLVLLGAIIEISLMLTAQSELQHATETATRLVRTGSTSIASEQDFRAAVCSRVVLIPGCAGVINVDVRNADTFNALAAVAPIPRDVGPSTESGSYSSVYQPGGSARPGRVVVTYDWSFIFPFLGVFGNLDDIPGTRRIYGLTVFMNEPF